MGAGALRVWGEVEADVDPTRPLLRVPCTPSSCFSPNSWDPDLAALPRLGSWSGRCEGQGLEGFQRS